MTQRDGPKGNCISAQACSVPNSPSDASRPHRFQCDQCCDAAPYSFHMLYLLSLGAADLERLMLMNKKAHRSSQNQMSCNVNLGKPWNLCSATFVQICYPYNCM